MNNKTATPPISVPETFKDIIGTFIGDLNTTFPEYEFLWSKWVSATSADLEQLFHFMLKVFPERMFDILTQNDSIFDKKSTVNTVFLPNVEFKLLFNTVGITDTTKQAIWKYLQLIMMTIMGSIKNKSQFGETADLFQGIDEAFLQEKLNESIEKMGEFFSNFKAPSPTEEGAKETEDLPTPEHLFEHLQGLFNGKIGSLAKEFAEEFSADMHGILNEEDLNGATSVKDILPKLLKDPKKLMDLVKSVQNKVQQKMDSGELSREDLMRETQEMMAKMQEMGGVDKFAEMLQGMAGQMGMGGKNVRVDKNALKRMESKMKQRDIMLKKLEKNRAMKSQTASYIVRNENGELNFVLGEEKQEKTALEQKAEIDKIMQEMNLGEQKTATLGKKTGKGGKPKKK